MKLSPDQMKRYEEDGFLILPNLFSLEEVAQMRAAMPAILAEQTPANFIEKRSGLVRTSMGLHLRSPVFARVVRHPRLVEPALQILDEPAYVMQVKVNNKAAFGGEVWQWHYDFATHHREDGNPKPLALNLHIFLDDVSEHNGPLWFIPGSHREGPVSTVLDTTTTSYPLWVVDDPTVARLANARGIVSATGKAGTALIFGDALVHGSPPNMSPWDRRIFSLILNPISNAGTSHKRPDHQHHRDLSPVTMLADDCLLADARAAG